MAKATYIYKKRENPTNWQIKRAFNGVEESVKRLRSVVDSCYESYEFAAENYHESGKIFNCLNGLPSPKYHFKG